MGSPLPAAPRATAASTQWRFWQFALPVAMLQLTYSRSFRQFRERRQMEKLYGVTAAIRSTIDVNGVRSELIRAAQTLLDAGSVRLVPSDTPARPRSGFLMSPESARLTIP